MVHGSKHHHVQTHSHSNGLRKVVLGGLAFLVVALLVTTVLDVRRESRRDLDDKEPPPSLQVAEGAKGSFIDPTFGYIQYQANDRQAFLNSLPAIKVKNPIGTSIPAGTNYLYTNKETTMGEIFRGIDPSANRLILAYYSSGERGRSQGFYTYAKGPFKDTYEIKPQDVDRFVIPANRGVVVMTERDTVSYGLMSPAQMTPTALSVAANSAPMDAKMGGWVLLPSNTSKISDMTSLYKDRVVSVWNLTSRNTFARVENLNTFALTRYFLVWIKLAPAREAIVATTELTPRTPVVVVPAATPTHEENMKTLSKYLKWERVVGSESQNETTGDLTVKYRVFVDNYRTVTDRNLRIDVLKNPHWGAKAWQIVHDGPYNIQVINGNITFAQNTLPAGSSTFEDQRDGSLLVKVRIPFPGIPLPSDTAEWGKVDVDFAFSDAANKPVAITSKYVTEQIARPSPIVSAGDGEVIFTNSGPGMVPSDYLKKIVFYSSGGENATSLYNIFSNKGPWWSGSKSNWYNLDVGSKNWLLYDKDAHNYDEDTKGHIGLPTIYSAPVASKDQDWKF